MLDILILTKRQYMNKDLLDDRFGRFREIPLALAPKGHRVQGLCLSYARREEGLLQDGPVLWESINASPLKLPGLLRFMRRARSLAQNADVIWACSDSFYGVIGYLLGRRLGIPVVFDLYDNFEYFLMARLPVVKQLYRHAIRRCTAVTCVSLPLADLVKTYGRSNHVYVLENAVRDDLFKPLDKNVSRRKFGFPADARIVGTAGALDRNRGIDRLFEAFFKLKEKHSNLHLALAGPRKRTIHIPEDPQIFDVGELPLEEVPSFLNALDVAVVCNLHNDFGRFCFPQKACEIMACGVPLVAAAVGSMKELFKNRSEWLYDPDNPGSLAFALERRLVDRTTGYAPVPSWSDLAKDLERTMYAMSVKT